MNVVSQWRLVPRWFVLHGLVRLATRRWAADGDPQAMMIADPVVRADPTPLYDRVRATGPLSRTRIGHISATHAVVSAVLRSDDYRTTSLGETAPPSLRWIERRTRSGTLHPVQAPSLLSVEPPDHTRYRTLVSSVFTARAVASLRERVQSTADRLLDDLVADAAAGVTVDIVVRYCAQLPVAVISDILGVPAAERQQLLGYGALAAPSLDVGLPWRQFVRVEKGLSAFDRWLAGHIERQRRHPGDDLLSQLARASQDGRGLDDKELRATAGLVLVAGFETTVNLLGSGVRLLMDHPDQLVVLRDDPSRWSTAVDEVLRLESPVQLTARVARTATTLAGTPIAAGAVVSLLLAGANRDPAVFTDPQRFDVTRANAGRHLSFSGGRHFCLGAALARQEGEVGLRTLFERFPDLHDAGPGVRRPTRVLRGWAQLPVRLGTPVAAPAQMTG